jgi:hypothetical protein
VWTADAIPEGDRQILCLGDRHFGAVDQDRFELFLQSTSGPTQIRRALSDEVDRFGATESCIALRTEDRNVTGFSLEDGSETSCSAQLSRRPHLDYGYTCEIISTISRPETATYEDMRYEVRPRRPGTPFLEVSSYRGQQQLWTRTTRFIPVAARPSFASRSPRAGMGVTLGVCGGVRGRRQRDQLRRRRGISATRPLLGQRRDLAAGIQRPLRDRRPEPDIMIEPDQHDRVEVRE